jgi:hypothetical protein
VQMKNWEPLLWHVSQIRSAKEMLYVRSGTGVGHGEDTGASVPQVEVLVLEFLAVDGLTTGALWTVRLLPCLRVVGGMTYVATGEVTTLEHELGNDTVEGGALVVEGLARASGTLLTSAESAEVLGGLRY